MYLIMCARVRVSMHLSAGVCTAVHPLKLELQVAELPHKIKMEQVKDGSENKKGKKYEQEITEHVPITQSG